MDEPYANLEPAGGRDVGPVIGHGHHHPGEQGGRGDPGFRGSHHRGYRRGGFYQRGRNFADTWYNNYDQPPIQNARRQDGGNGRGNGEGVASIPSSPRSWESSASGMEGFGRGSPGSLRLNSSSSRGGRASLHDNTHDDRFYAGGEGSLRGDTRRMAVAEAASPLDENWDDQHGGYLEHQDDRGGHQQRMGGELNRFGGPRRGSRGGRGQRFNERTPSDMPAQMGRRGGRSYHDGEDGRRVDRRGRGRQDENTQVGVPRNAVYSEGFEQGSPRQVEHSAQGNSQSGSNASNNTRRDGNRPGSGGDAGFYSRSGSSSCDNVSSENYGRAHDGSGDDSRGRREIYRGNKNIDRASGVQVQRQRRDSEQTSGRKDAGVEAVNGGALWRAKKSQVPQLVQELEERLTRGTIECMICYDMVGRNAPIWSCGSCYAIFHLNCIKKWARAPTSTDLSVSSANHSLEGNWRCPGCQTVELIAAKDLRYHCFCGQLDNPSVDHYLTPHSCGGPCKKPLDRSKIKRCNHYCTMQCHPGPCPPCSAVAPSEACPCGKKTFTRRCGEQKAVGSCGDICGRKLACGRHTCSRICHEGACEVCKVEVSTQCFCGKKYENMSCGTVEIQGNVDFDNGILSCGGRCHKLLSCENHHCREKCHPGPCGECELSPSVLQTCPCGKEKLQALVGDVQPRLQCTDPVPTCGKGCSKLLPCKVHVCRDLCHAGPCPRCRAPVVQKCRCGSSQRSVACHVSQGNAFVGEGEEDSGLFLCERKCGQKKSCGRHRCNGRCCPLATIGAGLLDDTEEDPHACALLCGKKLRCRQHNCQERCHSGHCPPCLESIFTELSCACGKTSIPPPVPCGTPLPACQEPCSFPQPCGHPATHLCHFGDCPPCTVPVTKECVGNHVLLRGVPCGTRDIKCNKLCGKTRLCGLHACARTCHVPPCETVENGSASSGRTKKQSCGQPCGAPRRDCSHTCVAPCHPFTPCPDNRCKVVVTITCGCGRISGDIPCDAGGSSASRVSAETEMILSRLPAPLQPLAQGNERIPLGQRKLSCDDDCGKLEKRRLLADAFGVDLSADGTDNSGGSEQMLTEMLRRDPQWLLAVEERFKSLLLGPKSNSLKVHVFCPMPKEKREVIRQLAERWSLSVSSSGREPRRFPIAHVTNKSKVPYTRLLSKTPLPPSGQFTAPAFNAAVDMEPGLVVAFFDVPREVDMSGLVLRFAGECELVWLNDKNALAIFGDASRAATALRRVDHTTAYKGAISVPGSAVYTKGAWGQAAGSSFPTKTSAKKKAVLDSSWVEDAWGEENRRTSKEQLTGAWQRKEPPITTKNPWGALEQTRARESEARLKACFVSSQPVVTSSEAFTKEGESSAQGERTRLKPSTSKGGDEQAGPSGASNEAHVTSKIPANGSLVPSSNEEDDWERLLD